MRRRAGRTSCRRCSASPTSSPRPSHDARIVLHRRRRGPTPFARGQLRGPPRLGPGIERARRRSPRDLRSVARARRTRRARPPSHSSIVLSVMVTRRVAVVTTRSGSAIAQRRAVRIFMNGVAHRVVRRPRLNGQTAPSLTTVMAHRWHIRRRPVASVVVRAPGLTSHDGPPTSMVVRLCMPSKLVMRVRSPSPALVR